MESGSTNSKIFGIGLSKTGTTSLGAALEILGYKTKDFPSIKYIPHFLLYIKDKHLQHYDAFTDVPVIPFYKKLDKKFPGSKFIYTYREKEDWLRSCELYPRFNLPFRKLPLKIIKLRTQVYGTYKFDRNKFSDAYDRHHADVMSYFKEKPEQLLCMNIIKGEEWEPLCNFLNHPVPAVPFPSRNTRKNNYDGHLLKYQRDL
ncbi:sulfotransferase family protein [Nafulsella turpanensis]|uniref:sulfotransferase family protein n=1 Tax=Nafulsella turpanensis TaxID=1265690 RepID=UPI00034583E8|nr:sulfotransferase family protein [Nafulsella turpanensis]